MCITSWLHEVINITPITLRDIERDDTLQACLMMGGLKITLRLLDTSPRRLRRQFFTVAEALAHVLSADNDQRSHSVCVQTTQTSCFDPDMILIWIFCLPTLLSSENGLGLLISYYKTWKRIQMKMLLPHLIEDTMMFLKQEKDPVCLSRGSSLKCYSTWQPRSSYCDLFMLLLTNLVHHTVCFHLDWRLCRLTYVWRKGCYLSDI